MPQMTDDEYRTYCRERWHRKLDDIIQTFTKSGSFPRDYASFNDFMNWKCGKYFTVDLENPTVQETIDRLHGPHTETLLKIIKARKQDG